MKRRVESILRDQHAIVNLVNQYLPSDKKISYRSSKSLSSFLNEVRSTINHSHISIGENLRKADEWLVLAKDDLKSGIVLYEKRQYAHSITHLQQSVEKLVKAFCLALFICSERELKRIGHKSPLAFVTMSKQAWVGPLMEVIKVQHPNLNTDFAGLEQVINTKQEALANTPEQYINIFINRCNTIEKVLSNKNKEMKPIVQRIANDSRLSETEKKTFQILGDKFDIRLLAALLSLYLLAALTYPHIAYTRYPDERLKPSIYTTQLGIVKKAPDLFELVRKATMRLDKYLEEMQWQNSALRKRQSRTP